MSSKSLDRTLIRDLVARCIVGVHEWERREPQEVVLNIEIWADHRKAAQTESLEDTVDYRALKKDVLKYVEGSKHRLLEALAENVARICLEHPHVERVRVTVDKPGALRFASSVAVQVERERS